jgi:hypothetical protein
MDLLGYSKMFSRVRLSPARTAFRFEKKKNLRVPDSVKKGGLEGPIHRLGVALLQPLRYIDGRVNLGIVHVPVHNQCPEAVVPVFLMNWLNE